MKGVNGKLNYFQSRQECRDKLVDLTNRWEMDDSDKSTMTIEADDEFMAMIYSVVGLLDKLGNYEELEEQLEGHVGFGFRGWIQHTTSLFENQ
jgi:hypothetical protein